MMRVNWLAAVSAWPWQPLHLLAQDAAWAVTRGRGGRGRHLLEDVADEASAGARIVLGHCAFPLVAPAVLLRKRADAHILPHVHLARQRGCTSTPHALNGTAQPP